MMASETSAQALQEVNDKASSSDAINISPIAREILENYSLIPSDEVEFRVRKVVSHSHPFWFLLA